MFRRKQRNTEEDRAKARVKALEKEKKKRKNRKYGQAELKHSKKGMVSCMMAACSLFLLVLVFSVSYISRGDVNTLIGFVGLLAMVLSWAGLVAAFRGFKEREKNYLSCKIGVGANAVFLLGLFSIFLRGLF